MNAPALRETRAAADVESSIRLEKNAPVVPSGITSRIQEFQEQFDTAAKASRMATIERMAIKAADWSDKNGVIAIPNIKVRPMPDASTLILRRRR